MANEIQTTVESSQKAQEKSSILSKITWFFKKSKKNWDANLRQTKTFHLTRRDAIVSVVVSLVVLWWTVYYWKIVFDEYTDLNNRSDELRKLSTYNIIPNDKLSSYTEWSNLWTINWVIEVNDKIEEELAEDEIFKQQQKNYYEVLLQNIYLPSLNVWKDPYTKNFNMSVLWQKYLEKDKFQDLYLIQYRSDFAKYVWNDADYNTIDNITIWDKVVVKDNPEYFYTPITISFSSPNKRSFLLLVNKISTTSNQNNISLLNEFFFHLLSVIMDEKSEVINQLMQKYWEEFSSSSSWDLPMSLSDLTEEQKSIYRDRVIWYNLYHWINGDLNDENGDVLIDDNVIIKTIKESALCPKDITDQECFYNFREKYRNLPYLAYKIWLEKQNNRTKWLLEFLQELPPALAITNFWFEKYSDSSFLNNKEEEYEWKVTFNAYGRNILDSELDEASLMLWKLCFWNTSEQKISTDLALRRINETIASYGWEREFKNISPLLELQRLFESIKESYGWMNNYDKMIKLFEIWRMMNDANLCNK